MALFNKLYFWLKGFYSGDKPAPRWGGALLFGFLGLVLIIGGVYSLFFQ